MKSKLENKFALYWRGLGGPELIREHRFHPTKKWRFDFAHPERKVAIEIEGGVWSGGRHTRGSGFTEDCHKYNEATLLGWRLFRLTGPMINVQSVGKIIETVVKQKEVWE